jgi:hypothetical protein
LAIPRRACELVCSFLPLTLCARSRPPLARRCTSFCLHTCFRFRYYEPLLSDVTKPFGMSSFAELKALRAAKGGASDDVHMNRTGESISEASTESTTSSSNTIHLSSSQNHYSGAKSSSNSSMYSLNTDLVEIRQIATSGRGLYAKKRITPSTVIMSRKPHVALLDKYHLQELCANCMMDKPGVELRRCSGCQAVRYCSVVS